MIMTTLDVLLMEWKTLVSLSIFTIGMMTTIIWIAKGGMDQ